MRLQKFFSSWCCSVFICLFCILVWESVRSLTRQPSQLVQIGKASLLARLTYHRRLPRPHVHGKYWLHFEEQLNCVRRMKNCRRERWTSLFSPPSDMYFRFSCDVTTNSQKFVSLITKWQILTTKSSSFSPIQPSFASTIATKLLHCSRLPFSAMKIFQWPFKWMDNACLV